MWHAEEQDDVRFKFETDPPKFNYEILYKQNVMTEDVYLGMSGKDRSSAFCDAMVFSEPSDERYRFRRVVFLYLSMNEFRCIDTRKLRSAKRCHL